MNEVEIGVIQVYQGYMSYIHHFLHRLVDMTSLLALYYGLNFKKSP